MGNPMVREGYVQSTIAEGLKSAGENPAGSMAGFMGMGFGMQTGGGFMGTASAANAEQMRMMGKTEVWAQEWDSAEQAEVWEQAAASEPKPRLETGPQWAMELQSETGPPEPGYARSAERRMRGNSAANAESPGLQAPGPVPAAR